MYKRQGYEYPFLKNHCFDATFPHHYVVDEQEYRRLKRESEEEYRKSPTGGRRRCPECSSVKLRYLKTKKLWGCEMCPWEEVKDSHSQHNNTQVRKGETIKKVNNSLSSTNIVPKTSSET